MPTKSSVTFSDYAHKNMHSKAKTSLYTHKLELFGHTDNTNNTLVTKENISNSFVFS